jgi:Ca2+-binding EF-hand superfamily protein
MTVTATDRVQLIFELFDADRNGFLEAHDFSLMAGRVDHAAASAGAAARRTMRAAFSRYWNTLRQELDADGDGRVSPEEFSACVLSPEKFEGTIAEFADALSALGDPDGDGLIERALFTDLMLAIGFAPANIEALFEAFEPDTGDRVRVAVWNAAIRDYYHPEKTGIAGDHLVG